MTSTSATPEEKMKATVYCIVLSEVPAKEKLLRTYLTNLLKGEQPCAKAIFDLCCHMISMNDPEFICLEDVLCEVLHLVGTTSTEMSVQISTFFNNENISNEVLKQAIRDRFPQPGCTLRESFGRDTLNLLKVKEFWKVGQFKPLMKNLGQFESLEVSFVSTMFEILHSFKLDEKNCREHHEISTELMGLAKVWLLQVHSRIVERKKLILNELYQRILEKSKTFS